MRSSKDVETLPQLVFLLADNLALDEKKREQGCDHIVEGSHLGNNIVIFQIPIRSNWKLGSCIVDSHFLGLRFLSSIIKNSIVYQ